MRCSCHDVSKISCLGRHLQISVTAFTLGNSRRLAIPICGEIIYGYMKTLGTSQPASRGHSHVNPRYRVRLRFRAHSRCRGNSLKKVGVLRFYKECADGASSVKLKRQIAMSHYCLRSVHQDLAVKILYPSLHSGFSPLDVHQLSPKDYERVGFCGGLVVDGEGRCDTNLGRQVHEGRASQAFVQDCRKKATVNDTVVSLRKGSPPSSVSWFRVTNSKRYLHRDCGRRVSL